MLVVITIIVLAMTLAVPAIRSLTGSRSQEAAQNVLTTALGSARAEAMALQRIEGIMFFLDTTTDRIMCVEVMETPAQPAADIAGVTYLDIVPDRDPLYLPAGVWLWTMKDKAPRPLTDVFDQFRYVGYNTYSGTATGDYNNQTPPVINVPGGVILFDATGRLTVKPYGFRFTTGTPAAPTQIGTFLYPNLNPAVLPLQNWPAVSSNPFWLSSQIGLCLFDRETFVNTTAGGNDNASNTAGSGAAVSTWLDTNTTPIFVNRYDATLMRAE